MTGLRSPASQSVNINFEGKTLAIEYQWVSPQNPGPVIVFLHEGLGSLSMWRQFPRRLCETIGCRGLVYSRSGYGDSTPLWPDTAWPTEFMHIEAEELLPRLLQGLGIDTLAEPPVLFGHSDGASIALIHAGRFPKQVSRLIVEAPHLFVEPLTIASIEKTRAAFGQGNLASRLSKYHRNADQTFRGWLSVWLNPAFLEWNIEALLPDIACPTLAIQGHDDIYGTMRQIDAIAREVPTHSLFRLANCGHSPHIEQTAQVLNKVQHFLGAESRDRLL